MIDQNCKDGNHVECTNPATCACQHRTTKHMKEADGTTVSAPTSERNFLLTEEK